MTIPRREAAGVVRSYDFLAAPASFRDDVLRGLAEPQKSIPPQYLHDERGTQLLASARAQPEYYPARIEAATVARHIDDIVKLLGPDTQLIELGADAGETTRLLIDRLEPSLFVTVAAAQAELRPACDELARAFPWLNINAVLGDISGPLVLPDFVSMPMRRKVVYCSGATIGAFTPAEAVDLLRRVHATIGSGGMLIVGVDLKKNQRTPLAAYEDAQGATAEFNLNALVRINRELAGDFQPKRFRHKVLYNDAQSRVELHLESLYQQIAHVAGQRFEFATGETIRTAIACHYTVDEFRAVAQRARFHTETVWTDTEGLVAVCGMMAI
jgi:dimethylhistidine N-methyltransferase